MLQVFSYNRNQLQKNLHWRLARIFGASELGLLLLIEISRNFVSCFSGPTLLPWLATPAKEKWGLLQRVFEAGGAGEGASCLLGGPLA